MINIIFNETLLNPQKKLNNENIDIVEDTIRTALEYFFLWFESAKEKKQQYIETNQEKSILSKLTYGNMRVGICGFFLFARRLLSEPGVSYVPMLWCTTSSIESIFSQCRAHDCVTAHSFPSKITIMNTRRSMDTLSNNKMYIKHLEISQNMNSIETATERLYNV